MEVQCSFCDTLGSNQPGADHDCIGNLRQMLAKAVEVPEEKGWPGLGRDVLLSTEAAVTDVYERMRRLTDYYSDRVRAAETARNSVYNAKQAAREHVNMARAAVRKQMEDVE